MRIIIKNIKK